MLIFFPTVQIFFWESENFSRENFEREIAMSARQPIDKNQLMTQRINMYQLSIKTTHRIKFR